jgi:hypothetical protein
MVKKTVSINSRVEELVQSVTDASDHRREQDWVVLSPLQKSLLNALERKLGNEYNVYGKTLTVSIAVKFLLDALTESDDKETV